MSRTSPSAVEAVLSIDYNPDIAVNPFIEAAGSLVDWMVTSCSAASALTVAQLELIERWLAAHFYSVSDQRFSSNTTGGGSATFQGQTAMNFNSTTFGQQAMLLDTSNCLAARNEEVTKGTKRTAKLLWLGRPPSEQTRYEDRK